MGSVVAGAFDHYFPPPPPPPSSQHSSTLAEAPTTPQSAPATPESAPANRIVSKVHPLYPMSATGGRASGSLAPSAAPQRPASPSLAPAAGQRTPVNAIEMPPSRAVAGPESSPGSSPTHSHRTRESVSSTPPRIKVRDLMHIQSLAETDMHYFTEEGQKSGDQGPQYEISGMPIEQIIDMVAGLLTKITTTNDKQRVHLHRQMTPPESASSNRHQTNSVLAFHGKNVPSITILSYLLRINKYCPTSYEVFLSLLVYFDRMMEKVNAGAIKNLRENDALERTTAPEQALRSPTSTQSMEGLTPQSQGFTQTATPPLSGEIESQYQGAVPGTPHSRSHQADPLSASAVDPDTLDLSQLFVVDGFNIHRLVIAGVTCASKFFSDIFYTNSRYAKVGGLPLPELNHLELQFLLLNDFRLSVSVEEIEAYGTTLVEFYAREILARTHVERDDSDA